MPEYQHFYHSYKDGETWTQSVGHQANVGEIDVDKMEDAEQEEKDERQV
jgi:hypothetical protein